ncbi:TatD family hydrolase [Candidatus Woesearchaeota archaeon]|jgi:TatD DNase family protein|nr:TatD family hydrolase [Candidatus Woesearchaeota archaeon]MBT4111356.1 TatD family hydrolase [Candidatus Woesearchaeota archaeon]MBT4336465.1 TatD family hydrolase [Candidatus Woesearchaeota archaeon]MBT4469878.1 TatD family hydrolase [Candidatus Woesearchaeota archaeon]MBT6744451.1 TatD family hydrolase [Candidatus Woesearchaeota archaeon]
MNLVDVHCHLNQELFKKDINEVIKRAKDNGVKAIIVSGTNPLANQEVLEMKKLDPIIKVSLGLHPIDALGLSEGETGISKPEGKVDLEKEFKYIEEHQDEIVAIGEIGLDYYWDKDHHEEQQDVFRKILRLAVKLNKPVIIHTWAAEEDTINILEEEIKGKVPVVLHCFGGRKSLVTKAIESGYYFSVPPSTVRTGNFNTKIKKIPMKQLLTETDAPWQGHLKGERNEPACVLETVKKIAEIKEISVEEAAEQIWNNYEKVFL